MVDLRTNTEMVLGNKHGLIGCTVDGGAALKASLLEHGMTASEGAICGVSYQDGELLLEVLGAGKPKGICGSGFIDLLAFMYENELLDELGHIAEADEADDEFVKYLGEENGKPEQFLPLCLKMPARS